MNIMISENLVSAICEQIGHEKFNANLYMFIAGFLKNKGLNNLGALFLDHHKEESEHAKMFFDLLCDLNGDISIPEIESPDFQIGSIMDIANKFLEREMATTDAINEIKMLAITEGNAIVEEFMRKMIVIQQAEYAEVSDFIDNAQLCSEDWWKVKVWNDSLE